MSTPRFCADLHMGHKKISKFRPLFESTEHNDLYWINMLEELCTKRDIMYFLGDIVFDKKYLNIIKSLPGTKILVPGNHDCEYINMKELVNTFDDVQGMVKYKEFWLTHCPIHETELRTKKNIHGHVHSNSVMDINYLNVSVDSAFMGFKPRTLYEVRSGFKYMEESNIPYGGFSTYEDSYEQIKTDSLCLDIFNKSKQESRKITFMVDKNEQN